MYGCYAGGSHKVETALQDWARVPACVPERQNLDGFRLILYTIVEMIADAAQVNAPYARETYIRRDRSDVWLRGDERESSLDGFAKCIWSGWPI